MSRPRLHDPGFLAYLRTKPCCICGRVGETQAAHIRIGFMALNKKPDDRYATPLCRAHHARQHSMNEAEFWEIVGFAPFALADHFYRQYGGTGGVPKKKRNGTRPRKPKHLRQKIRSRGFPKKDKRNGTLGR